MTTPIERMTRAPEDGFAQGDIVELDDIQVKFVSLGEGGLPDRLRFHLKGKGPLPELWGSINGKMAALSVPKVGQSLVIEFAPPL